MAIRAFRWRIGSWLLAIGMIAIFGPAILSASLPSPQPDRRIVPAESPVDSRLSVLTYNVEGLPWPIAQGREGALTRIAGRLRDLRRLNRHPHIVLLQEAFTQAAKRIGPDSGYRYVATGPSRYLPAAPEADPARIAFVRAGDPLKGEGVGKLMDSGLQILSDYPILSVKRIAFPASACAGYDCLANKGALMVLVSVPGSATPVAIVNTHLNARTASGVSLDRSLAAYRRQIGALDQFIKGGVPANIPVIIAGDLNVGRSAGRRAIVQASVRRWTGAAAGGQGGALRDCFAHSRPCGVDPPADARRSLDRNKDWQIAVAANGGVLGPRGLTVPFGREADGTMLSDHVGYAIQYRIDPAVRSAALQIAGGVRPGSLRAPAPGSAGRRPARAGG